jgi:hypothetical protein
VGVAGHQECSLDLADELDHAEVAREQLDELQHRDHDAARMQVIRRRADHPAGIGEQPQERPVLRIDPRQRQVLDVGEPAILPMLELLARAIIEFQIRLGERGRRHPHQLVRLAIDRVEPRAQLSPAEPGRPPDTEGDRDDEPEAHHEEEHFHARIVPRGALGRTRLAS